MPGRRGWGVIGWSVVGLAAILAIVGARPYAGGWNDGSRFAAVEALAEQGTFVIDSSIFVVVPSGEPSPYPPDPPALRQFGTLDKLLINGHYFSDKSPVPSVILAGVYRAWLMLGGPTLRQDPPEVIRWLTILSSGLAYLIAILAIRGLAQSIFDDPRSVTIVTASFAFATIALAYTCQVNAHILFLVAASVVCLAMQRLIDGGRLGWAVLAGLAAGFGYSCDLGVGPVLLVTLFPFCLVQTRSLKVVALLLVGIAPGVIAHHLWNYQVGGTLVPANAVPQYLDWPGSPFNDVNRTGGLKHSPVGFVLYAIDLVIGKKGILLHSMPLWLLPAATILLIRDRSFRARVIWVVTWCFLTVLLYAATSTNYSGHAVSVRWFVPLIAPGYWLVMLLLRTYPCYWGDFLWLSLCGTVIGVLTWMQGTWASKMPPGLWGLVAVALIGWGIVRLRDVRLRKRSSSVA